MNEVFFLLDEADGCPHARAERELERAGVNLLETDYEVQETGSWEDVEQIDNRCVSSTTISPPYKTCRCYWWRVIW